MKFQFQSTFNESLSWQYAHFFWTMAEYETAINLYEQARAIDPRDVRVIDQMANIYAVSPE